MGITGINVGDTKDYVLPDDRESKEPTIWKLAIFDSITKCKLSSKILSLDILKNIEKKNFEKIGEELLKNDEAVEAILDFVRFGLVGFSNFKKPSGEEITFKVDETTRFGRKYQIPSSDVLGYIPLENLIVLACEILTMNNLSGDEAKNS